MNGPLVEFIGILLFIAVVCLTLDKISRVICKWLCGKGDDGNRL